jgi:predicted outer membrane protein
MKIHQFAVATIATLMLGGAVFAQQQTPAQQNTNRQGTEAQSDQNQAGRRDQAQRSQGGHSQVDNQTIAKLLTIANKEQVLIARFAKEKASSEEVKNFATMMEQEHQAYIEDLNKFSSSRNESGASVGGQPRSDGQVRSEGQNRNETQNRPDAQNRTDAQSRTDAQTSQQGQTRSQGQSSSGTDFVQLQQEISEQILNDSQQALSQKQGAEFDKWFMGMQVARHAAMHSGLTVLERHAQDELRGLIKEGLSKNARHMQTAVSLMEQIESNASNKTTARAQ